MQFDINKYTGRYVMHCKTEEEANDFCSYLHSMRRTWISGQCYTQDTHWQEFKSNTAYNFNQGLHHSVSWYKCYDYTVLEWSDYMNKEFTKADLKTGDVVLCRNGDVEIVNRELGTLITKRGWNDLNNVREDLTSALSICNLNFDIVAVRRPTSKPDCQFDAFNLKLGNLVYERKEVEEMTLEEVCKALGKEIKIVK